MTAFHRLPLAARWVIALATMSGAAALAVRAPDLADWTSADLTGWALLTAAIVLAELLPVSLQIGDEVEDFLMTDVVFTAGLLLAPPSVLTLAVAAGILGGNLISRTDPHKVAFNVGTDVAAIVLAQLAFAAVPGGGPGEPMAWLGAAAGMAVYFTANELSMALVLSIVQRVSFTQVLLTPIALSLMQLGGNLAIGVMGAAMFVHVPALLPLLAVPLVLSYLAYRGWIQSMRERDRMRALYEAGRALFGPLEAEADFAGFLPAAARLLSADHVEVVVADEGQVRVHGADGVVILTVPAREDGTQPEAYVRAIPGLLAHTARIEDGRGVLAVYREQPLSDAERDLLSTLASQVRLKLENARLFSQTIDQSAQLTDIIRGASDGILALDDRGRIQWWNPAMERITGIAADEALATTWAALFAGMPGAVTGRDRWGGLGEPGVQHDVLFIRRDGRKRWVRYTASPMSGRDGGPEGRVVVARDVTAELEAEELKADFLATVSHELRTPLTPLKGYLAALSSGTIDDAPEARGEYYRIMGRQVERLEHLITDLLEAATLESRQASLRIEGVELTSVVSEQVEELTHQASERPVSLHTPGVPVMVLADPFRVEQVVENLLSNARKYSSEASPIEVTISTTPDQAVVTVRDEGPGIPAAEQERIFHRFQRLEQGLVREAGGTGLGLFIARQLVEAMGGRIWLLSRPGSGSSFSFSLPLAEPTAGLHRAGDRQSA